MDLLLLLLNLFIIDSTIDVRSQILLTRDSLLFFFIRNEVDQTLRTFSI